MAGNMADLTPTILLTPSHGERWLAGLGKDEGYWSKTLGDGQGSALMCRGGCKPMCMGHRTKALLGWSVMSGQQPAFPKS